MNDRAWLRASSFEFRFRYLLHVLVLVVGLTAPWQYLHRTGQTEVLAVNTHVWGILSSGAVNLLGRQAGADTFLLATNLVLILGIVLALAGAGLRTWATAYLGSGIMQSGSLQGARMVQDGPYRYVRNPLYVGLFLHVLALCLLMPLSGAIVAVVAVVLLDLRLIAAEEHFLAAHLGLSYAAYRERVPGLLPSWRSRVKAPGATPRWGQAFVAELYFWGTVAAFAFAGWRYNQDLILQCVIVSFGVAVVIRALLPQGPRMVQAQR